jgi:hypothetical protein
MDIASDIEKLKLVQESFEDTIDFVRDLKESIEILEERQNNTNKNVAVMDLGVKETMTQMDKRLDQLSGLRRETNKIKELVNSALISKGITNTLVDDLDLTYVKARKMEATICEMSLQLDDAKMLLEEFDSRNMHLSRQVEDLQSAIDRIKGANEEESNAEFEARIKSLENLVNELEAAHQAQNEQFSSGQAYINMLEKESEIDMNRDGTGREELIEDLKTMIKDNKKLKDLNDAGFKCILKYLEDGNNNFRDSMQLQSSL